MCLIAIGCAEESSDSDEMAGVEAGTMAAGTMAGTAAGTPAGTPAGTMAGTPAGMMAGTPAGMMAGTMVTPVGGDEMMGGTTVPPAGGDCDPAFLECIETCEEQSCVQNCFNVAPGETQSLYNAFQSCLQGANMTCPQGDTSCLLSTCETEYNACFGPLPMGTASCGDIFNCLQSCGPNDQTCVEMCINSGTLNAQIQFSDVNSCFFAAIDSGECSQEDAMCYNQACQSELAACEGIGGGGNNGPPPAGSLSCGGALLCAGNCEQTDAQCQQACLNGVNADEGDELQALLGCLQTNMCQDQACIDMNCSAEYTACIPPGTQSCGEVLMCIESCTDQNCLAECQLAGSMEAQTELGALGMCLQTNSCAAPSCPECANEYSACTD